MIILCALVSLAGFVDSIAGGGGLISLPAYFLVGFPPHMATATNKISAFFGGVTATYNYAKAGFIPWKTAVFGIAACMVGASIGANISLLVSDFYFKVILLIALPVVSYFVMKDKDLGRQRAPYSRVKTLLWVVPISFFIGMYDAFYGPGTGTFLILLYTSLAHMPLAEANGVSKAVNLTSSITSMIIYIMKGTAVIKIGIIAGLFNMVASYIGSNMFKKDGSKIIRPIMLFVLAVFTVKLVLELFGIA